MKKILSILSTISLSTIISTNIVACEKPNTNKELNKSIEPQFITQQPLKNSSWKLVTNITEQKGIRKTYIGIFGNKPYVNIISWKNIEGEGKWYLYEYKSIYRWDGDGEPVTPTIDNNTGEITDWNEKIEY